LIRNKLVLRNHFLLPICHLLHKDKELLALRNNFRATKKFFIAKFDYISLFFLVSYNQFQNLINNFLQFLSHPFKKKIIQNQKRLLIVKYAFLRLNFLTDWKESYCMIFFIVNGQKRKWRKILCLIVDCRQIFVNQFCLLFDHILPIPS